MGAAAGPLSAVMSIGGKGLEIAGGIAEGIQKKTAAQIESAKLKMAAEAGRVRAIQTDAAYRSELEDTMQTIGAIRSAQNVGFDSPTSMALYDEAERRSSDARRLAVSNERMKALGLEGDSAAALAAGRTARATSLLKVAPKALSIGQEVAGYFK
jgi:hypothetical protein